MAGSIFKTIHLESEAAPSDQDMPHQDTQRRGRAQRVLAALASGLTAGATIIVGWYQGFGDRQLLAGLDDRQLRDMGIDRATVENDHSPPFWRFR